MLRISSVFSRQMPKEFYSHAGISGGASSRVLMLRALAQIFIDQLFCVRSFFNDVLLDMLSA